MVRVLCGILACAVFLSGALPAVSAAETKGTTASSPEDAGRQNARLDPLFTAPVPELKGIME